MRYVFAVGCTLWPPGHRGDDHDAGLERLLRQYPRWRIWHGRATGDYWALPARDHPAARHLIGAADIGDLARRAAEAAQRDYP